MAHYHWFGPPTTDQLREQLNATPQARLEIRGEGEDMTLTVVPIEAEGRRGAPLQVLNESHPCPPQCVE